MCTACIRDRCPDSLPAPTSTTTVRLRLPLAPHPRRSRRRQDSSSSPAAPALTAYPSSATLQAVPPAQLLASARMTAFAHRQATGNPITATELADRLGVPPALAESLLDHIDGTPPPVTTVNGTVMNGSRP